MLSRDVFCDGLRPISVEAYSTEACIALTSAPNPFSVPARSLATFFGYPQLVRNTQPTGGWGDTCCWPSICSSSANCRPSSVMTASKKSRRWVWMAVFHVRLSQGFYRPLHLQLEVPHRRDGGRGAACRSAIIAFLTGSSLSIVTDRSPTLTPPIIAQD